MKKFIITLLLFATCFLAGNAQTPSSDSTQHKEKNHRGHHSHSKGDQHHKGNKLLHSHHHQGKSHARAGTHSHHGRKGQEKKTNGNK